MSFADVQSMKAMKRIKDLNQSVNLYDHSKSQANTFLNVNDTLQNLTGWFTSDYIPIAYLNAYLVSNVKSVVFYDSNKVILSSAISIQYTNEQKYTVIYPPAWGPAYMRISATGLSQKSIICKYPYPSPWYNKNAGFLGDSIFNNNNIQPYVTRYTGMVANTYGVPGTKMTDTTGTDTTAICRDERISAMASNLDIVFVMGGMNDWVQHVPLGTISDTGTNTYYGACKTVCQKLTTRYPNARIFVVTPPFGRETGQSGWTDQTGLLNNQNLTSGDYGNAFMQVARLYGLPYIDTFGNAGYNNSNLTSYTNSDAGGVNIHPNSSGAERIAELILAKISQLGTLIL